MEILKEIAFWIFQKIKEADWTVEKIMSVKRGIIVGATTMFLIIAVLFLGVYYTGNFDNLIQWTLHKAGYETTFSVRPLNPVYIRKRNEVSKQITIMLRLYKETTGITGFYLESLKNNEIDLLYMPELEAIRSNKTLPKITEPIHIGSKHNENCSFLLSFFEDKDIHYSGGLSTSFQDCEAILDLIKRIDPKLTQRVEMFSLPIEEDRLVIMIMQPRHSDYTSPTKMQDDIRNIIGSKILGLRFNSK